MFLKITFGLMKWNLNMNTYNLNLLLYIYICGYFYKDLHFKGVVKSPAESVHITCM